MKLKVFTQDASSSSEKEFNHIPTFEGDKGLDAVRQVVIATQANKRQGTHKVKTVAEVSGTGKKPFRQKGSGTARQGSRRAVHYKGGAVAHGPQPRDYSQKVNKKTRLLALQRVLFDGASEGQIQVIEKLTTPAVKTKDVNELLKKVQPTGSLLLVDDVFEDNVVLSARNLSRIGFEVSSNICVLELLKHKNVLITEKGMQTLIARVNGGE
jgi:large subunit ribosomal protein L4